MEVLVFLVPLALLLGLLGLAGFMWTLDSGQYDDLDGAAWRAISDDEGSVSDRRQQPRGSTQAMQSSASAVINRK